MVGAAIPRPALTAAEGQERRHRPLQEATPGPSRRIRCRSSSTETIKNVLGKGPYPGLRAATDTDLSLAFAWRFWQLLRQDGRAGVVLPRGILAGRAAAQWRTTILEDGAFSEVTSLSNSRNWMFEDVHPQYTIGLVSIVKGRSHARPGHHARTLLLAWPSTGAGLTSYPTGSPHRDFAQLGRRRSIPAPARMPTASDVFLKLRAHPRLDAPGGDWRFVPLRELHTHRQQVDVRL